MNKFAMKTRSFAVIALVALLVASALVFAACNDESSSPLPTDSNSWTLVSIVVEGEDSTTTYSVAVAEEIKERYPVSDENTAEENEANMAKWIVYEGMYLDATSVTVDFAGDAVSIIFDDEDGTVFKGKWKKGGESMGTSMIEYTFDGGDATFGTCGRVEEQDGTRHLALYVVHGNTTYYFTAPV